MLQGHDIVCFANDWNADPTSKHHLMRRLADTNRVLWIEASGMRTPNLGSTRDWGRMVQKLGAFVSGARPVLPGMSCYAPPSIPAPGSTLAGRLNSVLYRKSIERQLAALDMAKDPTMWVYAPHVAPLIRGMPRNALVYHCVDRWSAFAEYDAAVMARCEQEICEQADVVVASSADLAEHCSQFAKNVHYVPHGVDFEHFRSALETGPTPADVASLPHPRVGFFGLIHEWVNVELIEKLATILPYEFILIGNSNQDLSSLLRHPNVHHLGRKPFAELPAYSRAFDVAIVPFRLSELTASVNPIKLREYAAAGLPIVSVGLPEVIKCSDIARIAYTESEWISELTAAVNDGISTEWRLAQSARVASSDWTIVCERISTLVSDTLSPHQRR